MQEVSSLHNLYWISDLIISDIHWDQGTLKPFVHKLEPLSFCDKPLTVMGLRPFLGAVRFNEICLDCKHLANVTAELDSIIPVSRSDKDRIELDGRLNKSFCKVQDICKNPQTVFVPRKTDKPFIVEDAAPRHGPVINHEGTCCSTPRPRLYGRTMPGRPFERRNSVQP